ncbi:uncharacterized protein LOC129315497 [Prosopis cineraria]|uniref:uncharacterized protein LOC129315497 n=1 Tax=Prosopis cineraria TaxID=364024 RepID=UPI0024106B85|nr:uncharacterized protein LOC129315497 [Prosopis cineraria]
MASLVPICFVGPLRSSHTLTKRRHQLDFALGRLASMVTSCQSVQKVIVSFGSKKGLSSVNQCCHHHLAARPSFISDTRYLDLIVDYCTDIVISGYWVGPDIDDGWGFVEAIINQVT